MECSLAVCLGLISRPINYYCTLAWIDDCCWKRPAPPLLKFWLIWRGGALKLFRFCRSAVDFLPEPDPGDCTNYGCQKNRIIVSVVCELIADRRYSEEFCSQIPDDEISQTFIELSRMERD